MSTEETGGGPPLGLAVLLSAAGTTLFVASDISYTGTSHVVTGITWAIGANESWVFDGWIDTDGGANAPRWTWGDGVAGSTIHYEAMGWTAATVRDRVVETAAWLSLTDVGLANGRKWYPIRGAVIGGSTPYVMQLTQQSSVSSTVTIYAGSYLVAKRLV